MKSKVAALQLLFALTPVAQAAKISPIPAGGRIATQIHDEWKMGDDLAEKILGLENQWAKLALGKTKSEIRVDPALKSLEHELNEKRQDQADHYLTSAGDASYAYGLAPDEDASKSKYKNASVFGAEMNWSLKFRPHEFDLTVDKDGVIVKVRLKQQPVGALAPDGTVYLYSDAFSDPASMASTIYHERVHFFQESTPGWGNVLTEAEKQIQAYEGELRLAKVFGTPQSELDHIKAKRAEYLEKLFKETGRKEPRRPHEDVLDEAHHRIPIRVRNIGKPIGDPSFLEIHRDARPALSPCYAPLRPGRRVDMRSLTPNPLTRLNQVRAQNQAQQNQRDLQAEANKLSAPYLVRADTLLNTTRRCSGEGCWKSVYDQGMSLNRDILMNLLPQLQGLTGAAAPSLAPPIDEAFARMNPGKASGSSGSGRDYPSLCRKFELIKTLDEPSRESSFAGLPVDAAKAAEAERDYQAKLAALAPPPGPDGGLAAAVAPTQGALYRETPAGSVKTEAATDLGPGDTLRTGPNGKADLNLSNGHRVRLEPGTTLTLGQDEQGRSLYDVISGQIRSAIHCATGESPCALQRAFRSRAAMADATAAVRGTELALAVPASGPVSLLVREGLVEFRGKAGQTVWVGAGMRSAMDKTGSASVPETASPEELKDWFAGRAPQDEKAVKQARKRLAKARRKWLKAAAKEDKARRKRVAKDSAPWLARLGKNACAGEACFSVKEDPEGWGRACSNDECFDPRRLRPKEEELWLDAPLTKFQTAAGGVILDESAPDAAATLAGEGGRAAAADGWVDAFEAAGLEHGAALSRAYAVWERLPSP